MQPQTAAVAPHSGNQSGNADQTRLIVILSADKNDPIGQFLTTDYKPKCDEINLAWDPDHPEAIPCYRSPHSGPLAVIVNEEGPLEVLRQHERILRKISKLNPDQFIPVVRANGSLLLPAFTGQEPERLHRSSQDGETAYEAIIHFWQETDQFPKPEPWQDPTEADWRHSV